MSKPLGKNQGGKKKGGILYETSWFALVCARDRLRMREIEMVAWL